MTASRFNDPIEPMTIVSMRESGVRSLVFPVPSVPPREDHERRPSPW
jgi:hypothetical protein